MRTDDKSEGFNFVGSLRGARDSLMEEFAKLVHTVTSTQSYQSANAAVGKPVLLASAVLREKREAAMAEFLALLNLPSREEVLALSRRLTRIEMTLDDLGAGLDELRRMAVRPEQPGAREASHGRSGARSPAKDG